MFSRLDCVDCGNHNARRINVPTSPRSIQSFNLCNECWLKRIRTIPEQWNAMTVQKEVQEILFVHNFLTTNNQTLVLLKMELLKWIANENWKPLQKYRWKLYKDYIDFHIRQLQGYEKEIEDIPNAMLSDERYRMKKEVLARIRKRKNEFEKAPIQEIREITKTACYSRYQNELPNIENTLGELRHSLAGRREESTETKQIQAGKQLLEDHKFLFEELIKIPKARAITYRTERRNENLIGKPRFDPPDYTWASELFSQLQNHLQNIWNFFETSSYRVNGTTRSLIHPDERGASKKSIIYLLERDIWCADEVFGDYLIEKAANAVVISYYRQNQKRKEFRLPSMTDAEIQTWICENAQQQIENQFAYLWNTLENEIATASSRDSATPSDPYSILQELEQTLRTFIVRKLEEKYGEKWWSQGIPQDIQQNCQERKDKNEKVYPWFEDEEHDIIDYADFADYTKIIARKDNWRDVFEPIIHKKGEFLAKLRELEPIRNNIGHSRILNNMEKQILALYAQQIKKTLQ